MPKVMLTTPYPTIEETARMLGISAKERDEIVARVAVKAEALRGTLRAVQAGKGAGVLSAPLEDVNTRRGDSSRGAKGKQHASVSTARVARPKKHRSQAGRDRRSVRKAQR